MAEKKEKKDRRTFSAVLSSFLEKNRKAVWIVFIVILVAFIAFLTLFFVNSKSSEKTLAMVDQISFELTNESYSLADSELASRRSDAKTALDPLVGKSGVGGVRANMLMAEIAYQEKNYNDAVKYWTAAANKGKKSYTAPLAYFNIASCLEETGNLDEACVNYKKAADTSDFLMKSHAMFSYGRVLETSGKYAEAGEAYKALNDASPNDTWSNLAKTRLIDLKLQGKIE